MSPFNTITMYRVHICLKTYVFGLRFPFVGALFGVPFPAFEALPQVAVWRFSFTGLNVSDQNVFKYRHSDS